MGSMNDSIFNQTVRHSEAPSLQSGTFVWPDLTDRMPSPAELSLVFNRLEDLRLTVRHLYGNTFDTEPFVATFEHNIEIGTVSHRLPDKMLEWLSDMLDEAEEAWSAQAFAAAVMHARLVDELLRLAFSGSTATFTPRPQVSRPPMAACAVINIDIDA